MISTWKKGNCSLAANIINANIQGNILMTDLGYISTEFRGTLNLFPDRDLSLPLLSENFYEFSKADEDSKTERKWIGIEKLE